MKGSLGKTLSEDFIVDDNEYNEDLCINIWKIYSSGIKITSGDFRIFLDPRLKHSGMTGIIFQRISMASP